MPGLFGIIAKNEGLVGCRLSGLARRMADSMRRLPWLRAEMWGDETFCGGRVHLGVLNPGPQPLLTRDKLTQVWFDGELYRTSTGSNATPGADEVAELVNGSATGLEEIDGVFNLACFEREKRELVLVNDRLGFRPLYYTETEDWFAYAGEVKALLAIRDTIPDLDEISLRQFFGFDHMLGERTWWKGIELIPPASVWRISAKGRTTHHYWAFDHIRRDPRDLAEVQVEFGRLWSQDVQRHSKPGTMPLLLSGGLDSRLLLAELLSQGHDLVAITFGSVESPELNLARRVAAIAEIPHRACYLDTNNWWYRREEAIWQTDGLVNSIHLHAAIAMDEVHTGNWYGPMNIAGDSLFGGSQLDGKLMPDWRLSPDNLHSSWYVENPFFDREEVLSISLDDAKGSAQGPSSDCFHLRQRLRRLTLTGAGCLAPYCEIVFPGISHGLLQLMLGSLSDEQRIDHKFYNRFLVMRHPKYYGDIPWLGTGRGLAESLPTRVWRGLQTRLRQLAGTRAKLISSDEWFVNFPKCLRASKTREKLLRGDLIADNFLGGAARCVLTNSASQPLSTSTLIGILTFETYLRQVAGMPKLTSLTQT